MASWTLGPLDIVHPLATLLPTCYNSLLWTCTLNSNLAYIRSTLVRLILTRLGHTFQCVVTWSQRREKTGRVGRCRWIQSARPVVAIVGKRRTGVALGALRPTIHLALCVAYGWHHVVRAYDVIKLVVPKPVCFLSGIAILKKKKKKKKKKDTNKWWYDIKLLIVYKRCGVLLTRVGDKPIWPRTSLKEGRK